ncbi:Glutaminyl-tRNA synthetase [Diaporthe australafricana]|uniref:Glutaminyl-tRNA synthetase n=1 Tax=Diaporthe australafricana TaxID=127596 RepID=A0ABR3WEK5_9PEZI
MAENIADQPARLYLDEETGDMVSKNELKKRTQKCARKAATATLRDATSTPTPRPTAGKQEEAGRPANLGEPTMDADYACLRTS